MPLVYKHAEHDQSSHGNWANNEAMSNARLIRPKSRINLESLERQARLLREGPKTTPRVEFLSRPFPGTRTRKRFEAAVESFEEVVRNPDVFPSYWRGFNTIFRGVRSLKSINAVYKKLRWPEFVAAHLRGMDRAIIQAKQNGDNQTVQYLKNLVEPYRRLASHSEVSRVSFAKSDYETCGISEWVSKHADHDQSTHGNWARHSYGQTIGQLGFWTDEPYKRAAPEEYKTKSGTVKDKRPFPTRDVSELRSWSDEDALEFARDIFDVTIETESGDVLEAKTSMVRNNTYDIDVVGVVTINGKVSGHFQRTIEEGSVHNSLFTIKQTGKGYGTTLLAHWEDQLHRSGVEYMTVDATSSRYGTYNGAYTWAKYGYTPTETGTADRLLAEFLYRADESDLPGIAIGWHSLTKYASGMSYDETLEVLTEVWSNENYSTVGLLADYESSAYLIGSSNYNGEDLLPIIGRIEGFGDFLKNSDVKWHGIKETSLLVSKSSELNDKIVSICNKWMVENPVGLENDDPNFFKEINAAFDEHHRRVSKAVKNVPVDRKLYARVKSEAKRKFDVYPSAYANAWLVAEYKRRGGEYRVEKDNPTPNSVHVDSIMGSKRNLKDKRRAYRRWRMEEVMAKGDCPGHPFRGNQYTGGKPGQGGCTDLGGELGVRRPTGSVRRSSTTRSSTNPLTPEAEANLSKVGQPVSDEELAKARQLMVEQYNQMRRSTQEDRDAHCRSKEATGRSGGDRRSNTYTRAKRRNSILAKFGDGHTVPCGYCGIRLDYATVEIEKLDPVMGYSEPQNLAPACRGCNEALGDMDPAQKTGVKFTRPFIDPRC